MTELQVLDIIRSEFRRGQLPMPCGLGVTERDDRDGITSERHARLCWVRIARRIVSECDTERRQAARHASIVGAAVTRGRVR